MTVEELEGKLTGIYHEFVETISENETDEQIWQLETTSMVTKLLRLTRNWES